MRCKYEFIFNILLIFFQMHYSQSFYGQCSIIMSDCSSYCLRVNLVPFTSSQFWKPFSCWATPSQSLRTKIKIKTQNGHQRVEVALNFSVKKEKLLISLNHWRSAKVALNISESEPFWFFFLTFVELAVLGC